jgi:type II secretory pathway component PulF
VTDVPLTVVLMLVAAAISYVLLFVAPKCQATLTNYGARWSAATRWTLQAARSIGPAGWAALWAPAVVLPVLWAHLRPWPPRRPERLGPYLLVGVVLTGAVVAFVVVALILPLIEATHAAPAAQ